MIMLMIVTLLSVSAMRNTNLDTKIAVNHQFKELSFTAAENALAKVAGPDLDSIDELDMPTVIDQVTYNENFFTTPTAAEIRSSPNLADLADQPPMKASLSMKYEGEKTGLFFTGHQLDNTAHLFLAEATGSVGDSNTRTQNRMQVALIRHKPD
jgi:hypothetical protein